MISFIYPYQVVINLPQVPIKLTPTRERGMGERKLNFYQNKKLKTEPRMKSGTVFMSSGFPELINFIPTLFRGFFFENWSVL